MASIGSFVPASSLALTPIDRLFSRIGGSVTDDLSRAQSTFMAEMLELSSILREATPRSLVIVDEVGRGTSTFDGLSIAVAALEFLHSTSRCRALFATHYHELAEAQRALPHMRCFKMGVDDEGGEEQQRRGRGSGRVLPPPRAAGSGVVVLRTAGGADGAAALQCDGPSGGGPAGTRARPALLQRPRGARHPSLAGLR